MQACAYKNFLVANYFMFFIQQKEQITPSMPGYNCGPADKLLTMLFETVCNKYYFLQKKDQTLFNRKSEN